MSSVKCCCLGGCNVDGRAEPPRNRTRRSSGKVHRVVPKPLIQIDKKLCIFNVNTYPAKRRSYSTEHQTQK